MSAKRKSRKGKGKQVSQAPATQPPKPEPSEAGARISVQADTAKTAGEGAEDGKSDGFWARHGPDLVPAVAIGLLALFLFGWGIGSYSFADPWEPKYPQAVREMFERGSYLTPYYEDEIRWAKPVLIYWAQMATIAVWGNNEVAARLPSVLAGIWGLLAVYFCLLRLRGRRTAIISAAILASTPLYYFMARQATPDMFLAASMASAMCFLALARFGNRRQRLYHLLFYASVGVAVLAKGLLPIVLIGGAVLLYWAIEFDASRFRSIKAIGADFWAMLKSYHVGWGLLVVCLVDSVWYVPIWLEHGSEFVDRFLLWHNVQRFTDTAHIGLDAPASAYSKTLMQGMYPWFGLLPAGFLLVLGGRGSDERMKQGWYFLAWALACFFILSMANTKVEYYVLPAAAPLAVVVALVWERYEKGNPPRWMGIAFLLSGLLVFMTIKDFISLSDAYIMDAFAHRRPLQGVDVTIVLSVFVVGWVLISLVGMFRQRWRALAPLAVAIALCLAGYFSIYVLPKQGKVRSVKHNVEYYLAHKRPDSIMVMVGNIRPTLTYYLGSKKAYQHFGEKDYPMLIELLRDAPSVYIVADKNLANESLAKLLLASGKQWRLVDDSNPSSLFFTNQ